MDQQVVVGIDFGSSRIKAAAYRRDGRVVGALSAATPLAVTAEGDDFLVLRMLEDAASLVRGLDLPRGAVAGVGLSSMGEVGTILADGVLADIAFPSWYDGRGAEVVALLERRWGADELRRSTGNHARPASTVAKLGHLAGRERLPEGMFLGLCGAFAWQLTGRPWQEAGLAVTSGVYDDGRAGYLRHVWEDAGLSGIELPPVRPAGHAEAASTPLALDLGLADGAPVVIAGHDHPVAAVGAGVRRGEVADSMGTGEALIAVVDAADDPRHRDAALAADPYISFEVWPPTGEPLVVWERMRPGLAMRSFVEHSGTDRASLEAHAPASASTGAVDEAVSLALERGEDGGLAPTAASWAAIIEYYVALANRGQRIVREIAGAAGPTVLTGGGLRSPRWRRAKALRGRAPMVVSTIEETVTRGCAAMAGAAAGWWTDAQSMPGAERVSIGVHAVADMDAAVARIGS